MVKCSLVVLLLLARLSSWHAPSVYQPSRRFRSLVVLLLLARFLGWHTSSVYQPSRRFHEVSGDGWVFLLNCDTFNRYATPGLALRFLILQVQRMGLIVTYPDELPHIVQYELVNSDQGFCIPCLWYLSPLVRVSHQIPHLATKTNLGQVKTGCLDFKML